MRKISILLIFCISTVVELVAQPTVQWASRIVRHSSQKEDMFYSAKQALGPPNAMEGYANSLYSWAPKDANSNRDEYLYVEFGNPMRVRQFAIVESLNPGAISKVYLYDTRGKSHKVYEKKTFRSGYPMARVFAKKIPFTSYKVVGLKVVLKPSKIKGLNQIDAIAISNNEASVLPKVNALKYDEMVYQAENLGKLVNSRYAERLPIISPDGKTLYFTRKYHPKNIGKEDKDDIWVSKRYSDNSWNLAQNVDQPLNNERHNSVISVSPDNNYLYLSSAYKSRETDGVAVSRRKGRGWSKPKTFRIKNMYNKNPFSSYCVSMNGNILLMAVERNDTEGDRDLYVSFRKSDNQWSEPKSLGKTVNTVGMESGIFLAADNRTIYFSSTGFAGYGGLDIYMSRRLDETWQNWSTPQNLGNEFNTPGDDYNCTIPASGDFAYFSSNFMSHGLSDLFRIKLPKEARPEPAMLVDNEILVDVDEELDGNLSENDVAIEEENIPKKRANPRLQREVDALKEKLKRLNEEINVLEEDKNPPIAETEPKRKPRTKPRSKPKRTKPIPPKTPRQPKKSKRDKELDRLKNKYNKHLDDDYKEVKPQEKPKPKAKARAKTKIAKNKPKKSAKPDGEMDALRKKMLRLQGKEIPEDEPIVAENEPNPPPVEEAPTPPVVEKPEPPTPTDAVSDDPFAPKPKREIPTEKPAEPEVDVEELKEEMRKKMREDLRNEVKNELKKEMISDVRDEVADEVRIDLEDDLKKKVEDDLKKTLEDDVKSKLKTDLEDGVKDDLRDELADEVRNEVVADLRKEMEDEVRTELRKEMEYRLKKELETQIRRELEDKIRKQLEEEYANKAKENPTPTPVEEEEEVLIVPLKVGQIIPMNNIFFDANKTTIKNASDKELEKVVDFLKAHPNLIVEVGGHTNSWCSHEFANELSSGRAKMVKEYFVNQGISKKRIQYHGYGKTKPIADNKSVAGRKRNQRVEMKILEIIE